MKGTRDSDTKRTVQKGLENLRTKEGKRTTDSDNKERDLRKRSENLRKQKKERADRRAQKEFQQEDRTVRKGLETPPSVPKGLENLRKRLEDLRKTANRLNGT